VSVTLSPPIRVFALVGVLAAIGAGLFLFVLGNSSTDSGTTATPTVAKPAEQTQTTTPKPNATPKVTRKPQQPVVTPSGFPAPVHRALRRNRVVVVAVYVPQASVDAVVRSEARAAAIATRAGFVALSATSERLMRPLVAKTGVLPAPAVLVLRRPDVVVTTLSVTDRETVAQAVAQARR
jgi:hypothetical protein